MERIEIDKIEAYDLVSYPCILFSKKKEGLYWNEFVDILTRNTIEPDREFGFICLELYDSHQDRDILVELIIKPTKDIENMVPDKIRKKDYFFVQFVSDVNKIIQPPL